MVSHCRNCGAAEGEAEAVGCVTVAVPVTGITLLLAVLSPIARAWLIRAGWIDKGWIWDVAFMVMPLLLVIPIALIVWEFPVWWERLGNRWRRCSACGERDWEIGERGFGL